MLCQLSYSHRNLSIIATEVQQEIGEARRLRPECSERDPSLRLKGGCAQDDASVSSLRFRSGVTDCAALRAGLDGRSGRPHMVRFFWLGSADAYVFKTQSAQTSGVEQVLGINDDRILQEILDAIKVERTELRPARTDNQCVGPFGGRVG